MKHLEITMRVKQPGLLMNALSSLFVMCMIFFTSASIWQSYTVQEINGRISGPRKFAPLPAFLSPYMLLHIVNIKKVKHIRIQQSLFVNAPFFFNGCMTFQQPCLV